MKLLRTLILICGTAAVAWLAGLGVFVESIEVIDITPPAVGDTDAIVVLTGGSERLSAGFGLLNAHKGKKLFISGVHPGLTLDHLPGNQPVAPELRSCCVVLGHEAESTFGNAEETRNWMKTEDFHSLRLVTANYHMPRSLMVFRAAMPDVSIISHPVAPDNVKLEKWWERPGTASLLVTEYNKYLMAWFRLWIGHA